MARTYSGILGPLAFALVAARGAIAGASVEGTLLAASGAALTLAAIGYLCGQLADFLIRDSVQTQFQAAMAAFEQQQKQHQPPTGG